MLARFVHGLDAYLLQSQTPNRRFEAFVWLQADEDEAQLKRLLAPLVPLCVLRSESTLAEADARHESTAISTDHDETRYGKAWRHTDTLNTLRMLYKLRGVERLRLSTLTKLRLPPHEFILRIRPDIELLEGIPLPPWAYELSGGDAPGVYTPWACDMQQADLINDQLLLMTPEAAKRLAAQYEPSRVKAASTDADMRGLYPERLVSHAFDGLRIRLWPQLGGAPLPKTRYYRLVGASGEGRDPYAKLASDWPACFPRTRLKS